MSKISISFKCPRENQHGVQMANEGQLLYLGGLVREDLSEDRTPGLGVKAERRMVPGSESSMYKGPGAGKS